MRLKLKHSVIVAILAATSSLGTTVLAKRGKDEDVGPLSATKRLDLLQAKGTDQKEAVNQLDSQIQSIVDQNTHAQQLEVQAKKNAEQLAAGKTNALTIAAARASGKSAGGGEISVRIPASTGKEKETFTPRRFVPAEEPEQGEMAPQRSRKSLPSKIGAPEASQEAQERAAVRRAPSGGASDQAQKAPAQTYRPTKPAETTPARPAQKLPTPAVHAPSVPKAPAYVARHKAPPLRPNPAAGGPPLPKPPAGGAAGAGFGGQNPFAAARAGLKAVNPADMNPGAQELVGRKPAGGPPAHGPALPKRPVLQAGGGVFGAQTLADQIGKLKKAPPLAPKLPEGNFAGGGHPAGKPQAAALLIQKGALKKVEEAKDLTKEEKKKLKERKKEDRAAGERKIGNAPLTKAEKRAQKQKLAEMKREKEEEAQAAFEREQEKRRRAEREARERGPADAGGIGRLNLAGIENVGQINRFEGMDPEMAKRMEERQKKAEQRDEKQNEKEEKELENVAERIKILEVTQKLDRLKQDLSILLNWEQLKGKEGPVTPEQINSFLEDIAFEVELLNIDGGLTLLYPKMAENENKIPSKAMKDILKNALSGLESAYLQALLMPEDPANSKGNIKKSMQIIAGKLYPNVADPAKDIITAIHNKKTQKEMEVAVEVFNALQEKNESTQTIILENIYGAKIADKITELNKKNQETLEELSKDPFKKTVDPLTKKSTVNMDKIPELEAAWIDDLSRLVGGDKAEEMVAAVFETQKIKDAGKQFFSEFSKKSAHFQTAILEKASKKYKKAFNKLSKKGIPEEGQIDDKGQVKKLTRAEQRIVERVKTVKLAWINDISASLGPEEATKYVNETMERIKKGDPEIEHFKGPPPTEKEFEKLQENFKSVIKEQARKIAEETKETRADFEKLVQEKKAFEAKVSTEQEEYKKNTERSRIALKQALSAYVDDENPAAVKAHNLNVAEKTREFEANLNREITLFPPSEEETKQAIEDNIDSIIKAEVLESTKNLKITKQDKKILKEIEEGANFNQDDVNNLTEQFKRALENLKAEEDPKKRDKKAEDVKAIGDLLTLVSKEEHEKEIERLKVKLKEAASQENLDAGQKKHNVKKATQALEKQLATFYGLFPPTEKKTELLVKAQIADVTLDPTLTDSEQKIADEIYEKQTLYKNKTDQLTGRLKSKMDELKNEGDAAKQKDIEKEIAALESDLEQHLINQFTRFPEKGRTPEKSMQKHFKEVANNPDPTIDEMLRETEDDILIEEEDENTAKSLASIKEEMDKVKAFEKSTEILENLEATPRLAELKNKESQGDLSEEEAKELSRFESGIEAQRQKARNLGKEINTFKKQRAHTTFFENLTAGAEVEDESLKDLMKETSDLLAMTKAAQPLPTPTATAAPETDFGIIKLSKFIKDDIKKGITEERFEKLTQDLKKEYERFYQEQGLNPVAAKDNINTLVSKQIDTIMAEAGDEISKSPAEKSSLEKKSRALQQSFADLGVGKAPEPKPKKEKKKKGAPEAKKLESDQLDAGDEKKLSKSQKANKRKREAAKQKKLAEKQATLETEQKQKENEARQMQIKKLGKDMVTLTKDYKDLIEAGNASAKELVKSKCDALDAAEKFYVARGEESPEKHAKEFLEKAQEASEKKLEEHKKKQAPSINLEEDANRKLKILEAAIQSGQDFELEKSETIKALTKAYTEIEGKRKAQKLAKGEVNDYIKGLQKAATKTAAKKQKREKEEEDKQRTAELNKLKTAFSKAGKAYQTVLKNENATSKQKREAKADLIVAAEEFYKASPQKNKLPEDSAKKMVEDMEATVAPKATTTSSQPPKKLSEKEIEALNNEKNKAETFLVQAVKDEKPEAELRPLKHAFIKAADEALKASGKKDSLDQAADEAITVIAKAKAELKQEKEKALRKASTKTDTLDDPLGAGKQKKKKAKAEKSQKEPTPEELNLEVDQPKKKSSSKARTTTNLGAHVVTQNIIKTAKSSSAKAKGAPKKSPEQKPKKSDDMAQKEAAQKEAAKLLSKAESKKEETKETIGQKAKSKLRKVGNFFGFGSKKSKETKSDHKLKSPFGKTSKTDKDPEEVD